MTWLLLLLRSYVGCRLWLVRGLFCRWVVLGIRIYPFLVLVRLVLIPLLLILLSLWLAVQK